jgi:hypothetical protein
MPMKYMLKRLREPSTYAGAAAFFSGLGLLGLSAQDWNQILGAIAAVCAAAAIFLKEKPEGTGAGKD